MNLNRTQILKGDYIYPKGLIVLKPTNHFLQRINDWKIPIEKVPKSVSITNKNIHSAKTKDGKKLGSVVIKLHSLFVCFNPFDCAAKSIWYKTKKNDKRESNNNENCKQAI